MPEESSFEYVSLEADMHQLAEQIEAARERPEGETKTEHELVKEAINTFPRFQGMRKKAPSPTTAATTSTNPSANWSPLPDYAKDAPAETKLEIEYLCDTALRKGIGAAMSEAEKSPYFVQDAFRDALAGKLYPELKKRGFVK